MLPISIVDPNKYIKHQFTAGNALAGGEIRYRWHQSLYVSYAENAEQTMNYFQTCYLRCFISGINLKTHTIISHHFVFTALLQNKSTRDYMRSPLLQSPICEISKRYSNNLSTGCLCDKIVLTKLSMAYMLRLIILPQLFSLTSTLLSPLDKITEVGCFNNRKKASKAMIPGVMILQAIKSDFNLKMLHFNRGFTSY